MSEGQDQRNHDFSKGMTDAQFAYIEAERRVAELNAENAKLREQLDVAEHNRTRNAREYARMCHENDKLLELIRDMLRWMPCHGPCGRCERYKYPIGCEFERRRLELGIEVD